MSSGGRVIAGIILAAAVACTPATPSPGASPEGGEPAPRPSGQFVDDYGERYAIGAGTWMKFPQGILHVDAWDDARNYLVARNDSANRYDPGKWTRIDWIRLDGTPPWEWAYCLSAYDAPTADSAEATRIARPETPRTGCNGHPYTRLRRMTPEDQATADSAAKQKCREGYASAGADGAGLQEVDDMIPYDTTRFRGPSCGVLRRQDPRLKGAE